MSNSEISYKNWKIVSEAFGTAIPLGISRPNALTGVVGSKLQNERHKLGVWKKSCDLRDIDLEDEEDVDLGGARERAGDPGRWGLEHEILIFGDVPPHARVAEEEARGRIKLRECDF